ncbi:MAG TPA: hypothetical protein V6C58_17380 [Allocoleopsis sp.]
MKVKNFDRGQEQNFIEFIKSQEETDILILFKLNIRSIKILPKNLKKLYIYRCDMLEYICDFPETLTVIDIYNCLSLTKLPKFPSELQSLYVEETSINSFIDIPDKTRVVIGKRDSFEFVKDKFRFLKYCIFH